MVSTDTSASGRDVKTRHARFARGIFLYPAMGYVIVFMVLPIAIIATYSFFQRGQYGGIVYSLTLDNFARALDGLYVGILGTSVALSSTVTLLALLIGFPTALAITKLQPQHQNIALVLVILPFWTNFLIRTYAWIVLLSSEGLLNQGLLGLGIISDPLALLYTPGAVVMGLLYAYLPLMVLPIYAALSRIDPSLREAAIDLGASRFTALRQVVFPLAIPGTLVGCVFVFVPSVGNFIVPELLGGGKTVMVGNLIRDQFLKARDWPFGSVLAMAMVVMLVLLFALQARITKRVLGQG